MELSNNTITSQAVQDALQEMATYVFSKDQKEYIYSLLEVNPYTQTLPLISLYGREEVSMAIIDNFHRDQIVLGIVFGVRIGACGLSLITLWMVSRRRNTPVFILNIICLVLLIIHSGLYLQYLLGNYGSVSNYLTHFYLNISLLEMNTSVAANIIQYLIIISVKASLVFQCRVVFADWQLASNIVTGALLMVCIPSIGFWTVSTVWNSQQILDASKQDNPMLLRYNWVPITAQLFYASIITVSCLVFNSKLLFAIRKRRVLGLKQFGALQIIFTVGCQTMIVPTVLSFINFALPESSPYGISALTSMFVVISLPLSAMWASTTTSDNDSSIMQETKLRPRMDSFQSSSTKSYTVYDYPDSASLGNPMKRIMSNVSHYCRAFFSPKSLDEKFDDESDLSIRTKHDSDKRRMVINMQYNISSPAGNYLVESASSTKKFSSSSPTYFTEPHWSEFPLGEPTPKESNVGILLPSPHSLHSFQSSKMILRHDNPFETDAAREETDRQYAQFMASLVNKSDIRGI